MEAALAMRTQSSAARSKRRSLPVPANEEGAPYKRAFIVELSPWLCDVAVTLDAAGVHAPPLEAAGGGWVQRFADRLLTWLQRSRQRRQLATFSDNMLKDMGLSRADVDHETSRRFWQD
jgi:uncharacterized protein YjiS (DUF1127 family)